MLRFFQWRRKQWFLRRAKRVVDEGIRLVFWWKGEDDLFHIP